MSLLLLCVISQTSNVHLLLFVTFSYVFVIKNSVQSHDFYKTFSAEYKYSTCSAAIFNGLTDIQYQRAGLGSNTHFGIKYKYIAFQDFNSNINTTTNFQFKYKYTAFLYSNTIQIYCHFLNLI